MKRLKVVVYAIAKNEAKYARDWAINMSEADEIVVLLDPTSTDNTKEILTKHGVRVVEKRIKPWRFDVARNKSLKLVPRDADICVCTDLDELFSPGWRQELEIMWRKNTNQATYRYYHNAGSPGDPPNIFEYSKIHDRHSFKWKWAVHEYILPKKPNKKVNQVHLDRTMLFHYPDPTKSRSSYLGLLELCVKENKKDSRCLGLLAEEYINKQDYEKASKTLEQLMSLKDLNIADKCLGYKFQIRVATEQKQFDLAKKICLEAIDYYKDCKIFKGELGKIYILEDKKYREGIDLLNECLEIRTEVITGRETEWKDRAMIHNLISLGYYHLEDLDLAINHIKIAMQLNPYEQTYLNNKNLYLEKQNKK